MSRITESDMAILAILDAGVADPEQVPSTLALPRHLLEMCLVNRDAAGNPRLTREGRRALFQSRCRAALRRVRDGYQIDAFPGVEQWLRNALFLSDGNETSTPVVATKRGREWLEMLDEKPISVEQPSVHD